MKKLLTQLLFTLLFLFICNSANALEIDKKFIRDNLEKSNYSIDSEASAVVLYENRTMRGLEEHGHQHYGFTQKETIHKVIRVLKNDALSLANVHIQFYYDDIYNYVSILKAVTYTLENGTVVESSLDKKDVYNKNIIKDVYGVHFSLPSVKPGSIIEYTYEIVTNHIYRAYSWYIQSEYPKLLTEFETSYSDRFEFTAISNIAESEKKYPTTLDAELGTEDYCHGKDVTYSTGNHNTAFWLRRNVPALRMEPFMRNINIYKEKVELQMTGYFIDDKHERFANSWSKQNDEIWNKQKLDKAINGSNKFLHEIVDSISQLEPSILGKTKAIYNYVRSNIKCIKSNDKRFPSEFALKSVFEKKEGKIYDINLLLTAMLVHAGVDASPMLISTTAEIPQNEIFPVMDRIDYLVAAVMIDTANVYLDATNKNNPFGVLSTHCYNGFSWILGEKGQGILLIPEAIREKTKIAARVYDMNDTSASIEIIERFGPIRSAGYRRTWASNDKSKEKYIDDIEHSFSSNITLLNSEVLNENNPDTNLIIKIE
ncbi:MAG: DUF3857 and transglutaminase domain-containing protein [Bacteroidota bacterium]